MPLPCTHQCLPTLLPPFFGHPVHPWPGRASLSPSSFFVSLFRFPFPPVSPPLPPPPAVPSVSLPFSFSLFSSAKPALPCSWEQFSDLGCLTPSLSLACLYVICLFSFRSFSFFPSFSASRSLSLSLRLPSSVALHYSRHSISLLRLFHMHSFLFPSVPLPIRVHFHVQLPDPSYKMPSIFFLVSLCKRKEA